MTGSAGRGLSGRTLRGSHSGLGRRRPLHAYALDELYGNELCAIVLLGQQAAAFEIVELDLSGPQVHGHLDPGRNGPDEVPGRTDLHRRVLGGQFNDIVFLLFKIGSSGGFENTDYIRCVEFDFYIDASDRCRKAVGGSPDLGEAGNGQAQEEKR